MLTISRLAAVVVMFAQSFGSLTGTVTDPLRAVLPDARVVLTEPSRQVKHEVRTDRQGQFELVGLPAGEYQLEIETAGFQPFRASIAIETQPVRRDVVLRIGRLQETIRIEESDAPAPPPRPALTPRSNPPCPAQAASFAVGGNLRPPHKIRDSKPDYPAAFHGSGRDVTLVADATIGLDGFLKDINIRPPSEAAFENTLVSALREWQFDSTLLNCVPQEVEITITATFLHRP